MSITKQEVDLLIQYSLANNITDIDFAGYNSICSKILPTWRHEELAGDSVYTHIPTESYKKFKKIYVHKVVYK